MFPIQCRGQRRSHLQRQPHHQHCGTPLSQLGDQLEQLLLGVHANGQHQRAECRLRSIERIPDVDTADGRSVVNGAVQRGQEQGAEVLENATQAGPGSHGHHGQHPSEARECGIFGSGPIGPFRHWNWCQRTGCVRCSGR